MSTQAHDRDAGAVPLWDGALAGAGVADQGYLWGDPPVPYAHTAGALFAASLAAVVFDLPCGDGRNLAPLATGAPIVLAGDTSLNAMGIAARVAAKEGIRGKVVFV